MRKALGAALLALGFGIFFGLAVVGIGLTGALAAFGVAFLVVGSTTLGMILLCSE